MRLVLDPSPSPNLRSFNRTIVQNVSLEDLVELIEILKSKAAKHEAILRKNEIMTRYVLIDPLLRKLGWDLTDPDVVMLEDRNVSSKNKTDYRMGNVMIVEAKNLGKMPDKGKVRKYLNEEDVQYGVVTNGMQWNVYLKGKESAEYSFNLKDDTKSIISNAINLHRIIADEEIQTKVPPPPPPPPPPDGKIPIMEITQTMPKPPAKLYFPDSTTRDVKSWIDMLAFTVEWLVKNKHLTKLHCPIQHTPRITIINTRPVHKNGVPFRHKKRVEWVHINSNVDQTYVVRFMIKLINALELDPSEFKVRV